MSATRESLVQALAQINALQAQAASVQKALEAALQAEPAEIPLIALQAEMASAPPPEPEWTTLQRAAACGVHIDTMRTRAERCGLGHKPGGVWKIDMRRVRAHEEGRPYDPIRSPKESET